MYLVQRVVIHAPILLQLDLPTDLSLPTGFTGRLVARHLAESYTGKVKWAMAGRSKEKLESIR